MNWAIEFVNSDSLANDMHEAISEAHTLGREVAGVCATGDGHVVLVFRHMTRTPGRIEAVLVDRNGYAR